MSSRSLVVLAFIVSLNVSIRVANRIKRSVFHGLMRFIRYNLAAQVDFDPPMYRGFHKFLAQL